VEVVVNVQGDEPLVHPEALRALAAAFDDAEVEMATLIRPLREEERGNPNVVKALVDLRSDALLFTRADVPFSRDGRAGHALGAPGPLRLPAVDLLAARLPATPLERAESLEQLRALENGIRIRCVPTTHPSIGVDTPEDLARVEALLASERST
jgi:3-deoxy-manno-octulosonate cytidylyltransferase (CMP-KDO synthetase)